MIKLLNLVLMMICVLISVAFFTLMERKFISFTQNRKGPNKTLLVGVIQPISDAIKLLGKELSLNYKSNLIIFVLAPWMNLACSLMVWLIFPFMHEFSFMKMSSLFMMSCMAMNMLSLLMMSWSSNSNYALIGMARTVSQLVSYEINLILIIICIMNLTNQMSFDKMWMNQIYVPFMISFSPILIFWIITILAETNRTPFDFSEGESELISGFNIEYGSSSFVLLFLSEYASILMMSMISVMMFSSITPNSPLFYLLYILLCFYFIWARSTFPRFRYDKLMKLNWTQMLPMNTYILFWLFIYKMYCAMKN